MRDGGEEVGRGAIKGILQKEYMGLNTDFRIMLIYTLVVVVMRWRGKEERKSM